MQAFLGKLVFHPSLPPPPALPPQTPIVGRDERRAPLKTPAWEARYHWSAPQTKLFPSGEQCYPCSGAPSVYQDLSTRHDWPVKKAIVDLPIRMKGNSKRISSNSLSSGPLGAQNNDLARLRRRY